MNEHLEPIFEILFPALEKSKIDYWVYGGVSVAAYTGRFIRLNNDVDIFVRNNDFKKTAKLLLSHIFSKNDFKFTYYSPSKNNSRPKVDVKINNSEVLSIIPVYTKDTLVEFRYPTGDELYSTKILEKVERNISGYRFFTAHDEFIKEMFENHIKARPEKKMRKKYQIDAKAIFSTKELSEQAWQID